MMALIEEVACGSCFWRHSSVRLTPNFPVRIPLDPGVRPALLQQPTIVCGMTLLPADPKLDAAIRHPVPEDGPTSVITILEPRDCRR
jgi:hypothetical protein